MSLSNFHGIKSLTLSGTQIPLLQRKHTHPNRALIMPLICTHLCIRAPPRMLPTWMSTLLTILSPPSLHWRLLPMLHLNLLVLVLLSLSLSLLAAHSPVLQLIIPPVLSLSL